MSEANGAPQSRGLSELRICNGPASAAHHQEVLRRARDKRAAYSTATPRTKGQSGSLCFITQVSLCPASTHSRQAGSAITASI
jgi:hypothetical protein